MRAALLTLLAACGGPPDDTGTSVPPVDSPADTGTTDTPRTDTAPPGPETGGPDTTTDDTGPADTSPPDTGPEDTGPEDTGLEDTGLEDTAVEDTGLEDTGAIDTGPVDTAVTDTGLEDTSGCVPPSWVSDPDDTADTGGPDVRFVTSDAHAVIWGTAANSWIGSAVRLTGDLSGDGVEDIAVGAYWDDAGAVDGGSVYVFNGPIPAGEWDTTLAATTFHGAPADALGLVVAAGDLDMDGQDDLIFNRGDEILVYKGPIPTGAVVPNAPDYLIDATGYGAWASTHYVVPDMTGDGLTDLLVPGAVAPFFGDGTIHVLPGPPQPNMDLGAAAFHLYGDIPYTGARNAADAGDLDGDGIHDLLIGVQDDWTVQTQAGSARLFYGPIALSGPVTLADATLEAEAAWDTLGNAVGGGVDVDADGVSDFGVGAPSDPSTPQGPGAAYLWYSAPVGTHSVAEADAKLVGETYGDMAGQLVQFLEDVDGDGFGEVLVGAGAWGPDYWPGSRGRLYILPGPICGTIDLSEAERVIEGTDNQAEQIGYTNFWSQSGRDLDADGLPDFLFGSQDRFNPTTFSFTGSATIVLGSQVF